MPSIEPVMPWALGPDYPRWTETLRDGTRVRIRPVVADDAEREREFIGSLSPQSVRMRFLGQIRPSAALIAQLTDIDHQDDVAFAAVAPDDPDERLLGVARYSTTRDGANCECAVTVRDDWHGKGLGTVLMRHLIDVARARGILFMYSIDAAENAKMAELAHFLGFTRRVQPDDAALVEHRLLLQPSPGATYP